MTKKYDDFYQPVDWEAVALGLKERSSELELLKTDDLINNRPEEVDRVMRFAGKQRNQVSNPCLTARETIHLADWIEKIVKSRFKLRKAAKNICEYGEEVEGDDGMAMLISMDDYHQLVEALEEEEDVQVG